MSDDLVDRLRESGSRSEVELHEDREEAADRIEALEAERDENEGARGGVRATVFGAHCVIVQGVRGHRAVGCGRNIMSSLELPGIPCKYCEIVRNPWYSLECRRRGC